MTTLTVYGGVGEIGGNKTLRTDKENRVFLDPGANFKKGKKIMEMRLRDLKGVEKWI